MHYYEILLLRSSAPALTYFSRQTLDAGSIISVPLKSTQKDAVVVKEVEKPDFETAEIVSASGKAYNTVQMEIAKFISEYYFSSFSEAISLFLPYAVGCCPMTTPLKTDHEKQPCGVVGVQHPTLTTIQQKAYAQLLKKDKALLFGVTGSGKTEIFISLMAKMLEEGKTSIFLMPEISLSPQMEKRLKVYFGDTVAMWHSKITKKKKEQILEGIGSGTVRIIAGARSALFTPLKDLGLIIVDEEHDDSYKAQTRPRYHARDVAVLMGQRLGAKVVLASATPSAASYYKYDVVKLGKPYVQMKKEYRFIGGDSINAPILNALQQNFAAKNQSLLFLPTRGNFKYLYCESCGKTHLCPYCSVGMALHRRRRHLKCHYCNFTEAIVDTCTYCGHTPLRSERMGTQEAMEVIGNAIEGIEIEQFDRDSIGTAKQLKNALKRFESGESHLLLGTQMLSKGHDYANITLSVIMGLDHILGLADYRARERAVSLLFQVAGRSGRAKEAQVIVQTGDAEFFKNYLHDYEDFIRDELVFLEMAGYPPFASLARILIAHKDEAKAGKITLDTVTKLKQFGDIEIVGHGKAPVERIANKYRFNILLRAKSRVPLLKALHAVDRREIEIDMDPVEFS
ncbi:preprotein translocase subunit SecA [Sulfurovum lithotrophicum]|uniref:Replication restart protein PriA n=1 Tax=Sulfurovum lithotrophicum TaxID=206403 RepID=A0A7U4LZV7_9BACT|nr:primosomal protein N' [Sulfurovum lithotrophicum]AKF24227.1 preprotein translocase subunit SecA [Sulfurovum lithotrophicum]